MNNPVSDQIDRLLGLPSLAQQLAYLQEAKLLDVAGLERLLDAAEDLTGVDPERCNQLLLIGEQGAQHSGTMAVLARARYLRAQIAAIKGESALAAGLIEQARDSYRAVGMTFEALRTNVGLMRVLGQTGRHPAALQIGQQTLAQLAANPASAADHARVQLLRAMIQQNSGHCYEQIGQYEAALAAYTAAALDYQALGMAQQLGQIIENRGLVLMALGQVQTALMAFEEALQRYAEAGQLFYQAQTWMNIGEAHLFLGNYRQSLGAFEQAAQLFATFGDISEQYILLRQMADAYLTLNLFGEALDAYRRARTGLAAANLTYQLALTLWGMGMALTARRQRVEAQETLRLAAHHFRTLGNEPLLAAVLLEEAALQVDVGNLSEARSLAQQSLQLVQASHWNVQKVYAWLRNADLLLPDLAAVEPLLLTAQPVVEQLALPQLRYRLYQRLGHLRLLQNDEPAAQHYLQRAIVEIEGLRNTLAHERMRHSFLAEKVAAYHDLIRLFLQREDARNVQQAFQIAERVRSRTLVDLFSGVVQTQTVTPLDDTLARQQQSLLADLNAIYNALLGSHTTNSPYPVDRDRLKQQALALEEAISRLRLRSGQTTESAEPATLNAGDAPLPPLALSADLTLVSYYTLDQEILAFVAVGGHLQVKRALGTVSEVETLLKRLATQWTRLQSDRQVLALYQRQLERSAQHTLQLLHALLFAPLLPFLQQQSAPAVGAVRDLVIVPHGLLHQLPFHALFDGQRYLLEDWSISYAPSLTIFTLCQQRPSSAQGAALVAGVADAAIPAVADEVAQVTDHLQRQGNPVHTLLDDAAHTAALTTVAPQCRTIHLACHGIFRGDNPMFSALKLHDGWWMAADVAQLNLAGAFVTLSACESGRSSVIGGDEILGLTYAFLSAGAATVVVSQWLVQDQATAALMDLWYRHLQQTADVAGALRMAQLELMRQYPHPYYWAPFLVVGRRTAG